jgi:alkanesulfonate monooxygenase SsuD/methylene tetrahydromethanopterin reductase-like flavin-dependent oxidoreductase (luciferase family)
MRVGTAMTILPTHPPTAVAEQAALLDRLSGGRFDLGVGRGGPVVDYEVLGRSLAHGRDGMPEALACSWAPSPDPSRPTATSTASGRSPPRRVP